MDIIDFLPIEIQRIFVLDLPSLKDQDSLSRVSKQWLAVVRDELNTKYELENIGLPIEGNESYSQCMEKIKSIYDYVLGTEEGKKLIDDQKEMRENGTFVDCFKPIYSFYLKEKLRNFENFYEEIDDRSNWETEEYLGMSDEQKYSKLQDLFSKNPENNERMFLDLIGKNSTHLPLEIFQLTNLENLNLQNNLFQSVPPEINKLTQLQGLYLNKNRLKTLPKEIGGLSHLISFNATSNELQSLPLEFRRLSRLRDLHLFLNPFEELNPEILNTDVAVILNNPTLKGALKK